MLIGSSSRHGETGARAPIDETLAWTGLSINLLVLPGLGSLLVRRRIAGAAQAMLAGVGAALSVWWLALLVGQWTEEGSFPWDGGDAFHMGVTGVLVFGVAWMWSLATSLSVIRGIRMQSHRDTQTQRTERLRDFLVTGTDTGVGKSVVAAGLVLALRAGGRRAIGFKPVETGVEPGVMTDSALLARASGADEPLAQPLLSLPEALAPAVAADRAGVPVERKEIEARVGALRERYESLVIEGAGGAAVPLAWGYTFLDLAQRLHLPVVVVARPGLGTINHVCLTVEALRARDVPVTAVVLNRLAPLPDLAEATNPEALARLVPGVRFITLPRMDTADSWEVASRLAPLLATIIEN